jgi:hypothetical protein
MMEFNGCRDLESFLRSPSWVKLTTVHVQEVLAAGDMTWWRSMLGDDCRWIREHPRKLGELVTELRKIVRDVATRFDKPAREPERADAGPFAISDLEMWVRTVHDGESLEDIVAPLRWNDSGWDD